MKIIILRLEEHALYIFIQKKNKIYVNISQLMQNINIKKCYTENKIKYFNMMENIAFHQNNETFDIYKYLDNTFTFIKSEINGIYNMFSFYKSIFKTIDKIVLYG